MLRARPWPTAIASNSRPPLFSSTPAAASCCARWARSTRRPCAGPWPPHDRTLVSAAGAPAVRRVLVVVLDGGGLGADDPPRNPFAAAEMPEMMRLLGGARLLEETAPYEGPLAPRVAVDACLGVPGAPQSATGQAALVTGRNVPQALGEHYGPKPNPAVAQLVREDNIFQQVLRRGGRAALLNAYPPRYFEGIESGRRLYSSIPLAAVTAGLALRTAEDLAAENALSADFTGLGRGSPPGVPPGPAPDRAPRRPRQPGESGPARAPPQSGARAADWPAGSAAPLRRRLDGPDRVCPGHSAKDLRLIA